MIAVDTNIVVRLLTGDDRQQFDKALHLFEEHDIFIPDSVILEMEWVLRYAYAFTPDAICSAYNKLFGLPNVHTTNPTLIAQAIQWHEQGLDFADALHLSLCQKYDVFFTFDKDFVHKANGLGRCSVLKP
uniref:Predicted nucleic-acid-binding protein, contains PIN domain n=1 Tax=Candidatus Kentrum sp. TUN TaxID=2126343 RepID=A0A451AR00_9GAMM|nr:MAG: Predicted nucleic-acid-binding protein, contains PIN domain [Candidatus Kentron sp. TUN]VFK63199.1 MAG: Predicted nucleic-acid-binding protein, contains PIN domain [Candidatus Kentron sp. TUN]VFK68459.1 MAG: Predicted nucleic-acid-binding protein, contains PIN domain [Candidatus Kentron sp. TUN]